MEQVKKTPVALVALAWLLVGIPWGWGVAQLWKNAQKLFQSPPPAATAPAATAPAGATPAAPSSK
ncbi:MAG TPA: hypothetical protein VGK24_16210 [Candidatus Angelobacter sp.]|jgi:hypothetical protein